MKWKRISKQPELFKQKIELDQGIVLEEYWLVHQNLT